MNTFVCNSTEMTANSDPYYLLGADLAVECSLTDRNNLPSADTESFLMSRTWDDCALRGFWGLIPFTEDTGTDPEHAVPVRGVCTRSRYVVSRKCLIAFSRKHQSQHTHATFVFLRLLTCARRKIEASLYVFSHQEPGMMTPQQVMRRRMMPCILEDTMSTSGTSAQKTVPPAATPSASPTHIHPRWTRSGTSIQDSSVHCSSAKQVSGGVVSDNYLRSERKTKLLETFWLVAPFMQI